MKKKKKSANHFPIKNLKAVKRGQYQEKYPDTLLYQYGVRFGLLNYFVLQVE